MDIRIIQIIHDYNIPNGSKEKETRQNGNLNLAYEGILKSNCKTKFKQATYMVIDTFISKSQLSEQLDIVNHVSNSDGRNIKLIIGSKVASEGLDFKNIRSVWHNGSWVHLNRLEQIIGKKFDIVPIKHWINNYEM